MRLLIISFICLCFLSACATTPKPKISDVKQINGKAIELDTSDSVSPAPENLEPSATDTAAKLIRPIT